MQRYGLGIVVVWWTLLGLALAQSSGPQQSPAPCARRRACLCGIVARAMARTAVVMARLPRRSVRPPPISRALHSGMMGFSPVAEVAALIDGRTVIPAHGSREMPIWGARFGEMAGGGPAGEAVVHDVLRMLIDYLQAIQR
jgi:hypothetical protein